MGYPFWHGQTGLQTIDVVLPCVAFIGSLNIVDILFVKSTKDRAGWGFMDYWCHLLTLPVDEPTGNNPRVVAAKRLIFVFGKLALNTLVMYAVPPPHQFAQLHGWKYIAYSGLAGLAIYALLGGVIEGVFVFMSLLTGIEMKPMFENPLMAGSIREFWARWNIAIKQGFHRAIFTLSMKRREAAAANGHRVTSKKPRNKPKGPMARIKHNDYLSETEAPTSANDTDTDGEAPRKHSFKQGGSLRGMTPMTEGKDKLNQHASELKKAEETTKSRQGVKKSTEKDAPKKKKGGFLKKAAAAMVVFFASGFFHEYMNYMTFRDASGENMAFFLINGLLTVTQVWIKRNVWFFKNHKLPWVVGNLMVLAMTSLLAPLFVAPYVRGGFFEQAKNYGLLGKTPGTVWVWGLP